MTKGRACLWIALSSILTALCVCVGLVGLGAWLGPPPHDVARSGPVSIPSSTMPQNQTRDGLVFSVVRVSPFSSEVAFVQTPPGNWWRVDIAIYNPANRPLKVTTYDIVLRDAAGREFWYNRELTYFAIRDNQVVAEINPDITTQVSIVYELPENLTGLSLHYDGASVEVQPENIRRQ